MAGLGLLVLRLALAAVFVAHGSNELFGAWAGPGVGKGGLANTAALYASLGVHPEFVLAVLASVTQLVGGLLVGVGYFTRWASAAIIIYLAIGIWKAHWPWGFFLNWTGAPGRGQGIEFSVVLTSALVCLILTGAGRWSIDGQRASSRATRAAGRARLRGAM
jgi:putative oxidoreductase